jgi:biopolymer transport protein ExbB/TolQ
VPIVVQRVYACMRVQLRHLTDGKLVLSFAANENGKAQDQLKALPMSGLEILGVVLTVALLVGLFGAWKYYS